VLFWVGVDRRRASSLDAAVRRGSSFLSAAARVRDPHPHGCAGDQPQACLLAFFVVLPHAVTWIVATEHFDVFSVFIPVYVFLAIPVIQRASGKRSEALSGNAPAKNSVGPSWSGRLNGHEPCALPFAAARLARLTVIAARFPRSLPGCWVVAHCTEFAARGEPLLALLAACGRPPLPPTRDQAARSLVAGPGGLGHARGRLPSALRCTGPTPFQADPRRSLPALGRRPGSGTLGRNS